MDHFEHYDDMLEFITRAESPASGDFDNASRKANNLSWTGGLNWKRTVEVARDGWPEGSRMAQEFLSKLQEINPPLVEHTELVMAEAPGGFIDIDTFLMGEPEHWVDFAPKTQTRPIKILCSGITSSHNSPLSMINRGCAIAALIDILENRGYAVQLDISFVCQDPDYYQLTVTTKQSEQPLDLDTVVFTTAHPAMARRLTFAIQESAPASFRERNGFHAGEGYGIPQDARADCQAKYDLCIPTLSHMSEEFTTIASTQEWIAKLLTRKHFTAARGANHVEDDREKSTPGTSDPEAV